MTEIYGLPSSPRVVRSAGGWMLTVGDQAPVYLTPTDFMWLKKSMDEAVDSELCGALYGGGRRPD